MCVVLRCMEDFMDGAIGTYSLFEHIYQDLIFYYFYSLGIIQFYSLRNK